MDKIKILCVGACSNIEKNKFTGQSVMFDGILSKLKSNGDDLTIVDISPRFMSKYIFLRSIDYSIVLVLVFWHLLTTRYDIGYITTAQSKNGFIRDNAIISLFRLFKVKVIAHQYGANYNQLLEALGENGKNRLISMLNYCSKVIVEGQHMKNQYSFLKNYEEKVCIIPNGLPTLGANAMKPKEFFGTEPFILYYLSNLIWSKGYFDVLQAVDLLVNKYNKKVECVFAGQFMSSVDDLKPNISSKEDYDSFINEHHLESVVSYYPGMYSDEKDKAFSKSHVFILPTYYINEGQPVSVIEAMAYGCVPIVTNYRHIPMMVNDCNGCFVEAKQPEQIAQTIIYLMDHPEEYAAKSLACIQDYMEKFTFDKYASKVLQCMNEVVNS